MSASFTLRPYAAGDENAAIDLWFRTWQQAYPLIDFAQRLEGLARALAGRTGAGCANSSSRNETATWRASSPSMHRATSTNSWSHPKYGGSDLGNVLIGKAKAMSPAASRCWSTRITPARSAFMERNGLRPHP